MGSWEWKQRRCRVEKEEQGAGFKEYRYKDDPPMNEVSIKPYKRSPIKDCMQSKTKIILYLIRYTTEM